MCVFDIFVVWCTFLHFAFSFHEHAGDYSIMAHIKLPPCLNFRRHKLLFALGICNHLKKTGYNRRWNYLAGSLMMVVAGRICGLDVQSGIPPRASQIWSWEPTTQAAEPTPGSSPQGSWAGPGIPSVGRQMGRDARNKEPSMALFLFQICQPLCFLSFREKHLSPFFKRRINMNLWYKEKPHSSYSYSSGV